jgi:hypothetical protein
LPIQEGVLIACKSGVVELTISVVDPERDEAEAFAAEVNARLFDHQHQVMSDPTILDPDDLAVATALVSRDPLPEPLRGALRSLGFEAVEGEGGGVEERSMFSRFQKTRRSKLDKWLTPYLRARDVSPRLAMLEELLIDEAPSGPLTEIGAEASEVFVRAAEDALHLELSPSFEALGRVEKQLLQERAQRRGRLVLHPAAVRALACFTGESIRAAAPRTRWAEDLDDDAPLWVHAPKGGIVRTDPVFRVVNFVAKGSKEMLTSYVESVLRQSLTAATQS